VEDEEDDSRNMTLTVASSGEGQRKNAMIRTIQRTSGLEAPIVALGGAHGVCCDEADCWVKRANEQGEITACKFDPSGQTLAACSTDKSICASINLSNQRETDG
jgi:Prp8 binding protein